MFYRVLELALFLHESEEILIEKAAKELSVSPEKIKTCTLYRKSLDARKDQILYRCAVDVVLKSGVLARPSKKCTLLKEAFTYHVPKFSKSADRPVVVGFGPAGMFAALLLARAGLCPLVIERGKRVEERVLDVESFNLTGKLSPSSNIQFGEGGAGTFSDGKLNTLLKDKNRRGRFVLEEFVRFGAPEEILYLNKPHIGTDRLRKVVRALREEIIRLGGEVRFETRLEKPIVEHSAISAIEILSPEGKEIVPCSSLFLGIGHSARDTFRALAKEGIPMEKKIFSVGVRIEHLQEKINATQFGAFSDSPLLPAADYKLAVPTASGKNLYTFCMCPGGEVVAVASEQGGVVTNGMSFFARGGKNANSALLLNVLPEELPEDLFAGFDFQRKLEEKAFLAGVGEYRAPCQLVGDFLAKKESRSLGEVLPSYPRGFALSEMETVLPESLCASLREGIFKMGKKLEGFDAYDAVLTAVESRATSPVRILRGEDFQSEIRGLYPIGEGAGYAGGILSSAMDGMKAAEAYFASLSIPQS